METVPGTGGDYLFSAGSDSGGCDRDGGKCLV